MNYLITFLCSRYLTISLTFLSACSFLRARAIVLADEPTGNLDSKTAANLIDLFNVINDESGQTFVLVTHDSEVAESADRITYMKDGIIVDEIRKETKPPIIENEYARKKGQILKTLDELCELYVTSQIERELYNKLKSEYVRRLSRIELAARA